MNFLHTWHPQSIAFSCGLVDVYWYGIIITSAIVIGLIIALHIATKKQVDTNHIFNLFFYLIVFGVIGGRLFHVVGDWQYYQSHLGEVFKVWQGGLAFFGVLISSVVVVYIYCRIRKLSFWQLTDILVITVPLMQSIGRWGNYFNQEIYGLPTSSPWGIPIDFNNRLPGFEQFEYFQPQFLFESASLFLLFILLLVFSDHTKFKRGQLTLMYFILFSVIRFFMDFIRIGMPEIGPLLVTQWLSLILLIISLFSWFKLFNRGKMPAQ